MLIFSQMAKRDLRNIYDYIRQDSLYYAKREEKSIRDTVKRLKLMPFIGKKFEKSDDEFTRELVFKNYRIIYDIVPDKRITILTIHHHARLISNNPAFKDDE